MLFIAVLSLASFVWRSLFSEIHLTAEREDRVSPWFGKRMSNQIKVDQDILTGGGVAGDWAP
ncbi:MAG: hypothetical protein EOP09_11790 [Proteobacteria bacterium]|nr:MAG: hypothetical protein EOP09_11790 [Pseudomonadota bacterium]